jgi:hypothetical protein
MMRLTAVVPATDDPPTLARSLAAIERARLPPEEVVVVDRAPEPGAAAARNAGAARATGDILVFVDADVVPHEDAFTVIRAAFERDPGLAGVFGAYDEAPAAPGTVSRFRNLLHHHVHETSAGPATTFWAGLGALRRSSFEAVGGFDARRYPVASIEDIDLGLRLTDAGHRLVLDPRVQGTHLKRWTLASMVRDDFARRGVPWTQLVLTRRDTRPVLNLSWSHRLSAIASLAAVVGIVTRRPQAAAAGIACVVVLNLRFYRLVLRRFGPAQAVAAIPLHVVHHLTGVAAAASVVISAGRSGRSPQPR